MPFANLSEASGNRKQKPSEKQQTVSARHEDALKITPTFFRHHEQQFSKHYMHKYWKTEHM